MPWTDRQTTAWQDSEESSDPLYQKQTRQDPWREEIRTPWQKQEPLLRPFWGWRRFYSTNQQPDSLIPRQEARMGVNPVVWPPTTPCISTHFPRSEILTPTSLPARENRQISVSLLLVSARWGRQLWPEKQLESHITFLKFSIHFYKASITGVEWYLRGKSTCFASMRTYVRIPSICQKLIMVVCDSSLSTRRQRQVGLKNLQGNQPRQMVSLQISEKHCLKAIR